ncbi:MAG: PVC-type heme-binding CxxCH protein [Balneolaceae bacterium]
MKNRNEVFSLSEVHSQSAVSLLPYGLILTGCLILLMMSSCSENRYRDPLSVDEALQSFHLHEDFEIEIFASEPHIVDPVEMVFDESGNAYVMEMSDYPFKDKDLSDDQVVGEVSMYPYHPEVIESGGRIRLIVDSNGNGRIDSSAVFAEGIREGTSILPWEGGLLVTSAPDILYLKDTTGDFQADTKEVLFTGFSTSNVQAQITSLRYGVDNWIYASNDGRPGKVTSGRNPEAPAISMRGADFRFRLDTGEFERATGVGRVGRTINDWGHRFMTAAVPHIRQAVIPHRYLDRHSHLPSANAIENINDHGLTMFQLTSAPHWRVERSARRQKQYNEAGLDRTEDVKGEFTGATGGTIYTGQAFPEEYYGNIFTGEHAGNLVHRDVLSMREGSPVYIASRDHSEKEREFLASTDPWFRPTTFTVGPDGYLYVVDMYRQHTEHPIAIPEDLKVNPDVDFTQGLEYGRIYRILPKNENPAENYDANLKKMDQQQWIEMLSHPGQWWRLTAQRLLLEQQDKSMVPAVTSVLFDNNKDARARLHALYVLEGLNSLNRERVEQAMQDPQPGVREHGMKLSEEYPELLPKLLEGVNDESIFVSFQATLSAGEFEGHRVISTLADVVEQYGYDSWFRTAVISSQAGSSLEMMKELVSRETFSFNSSSGESIVWKLKFLEDLAFAVGSRNLANEVKFTLDQIQTGFDRIEGWQRSALEGLANGLKKHEESNPELKRVLQNLQVVFSADNLSSEEIEETISLLKNMYLDTPDS